MEGTALRPGRTTGATVLLNLLAWAAKELNLIPSWVPFAVVALSVVLLPLVVWPWVRDWARRRASVHLRSPFFIPKPSDARPPTAMPPRALEVITQLTNTDTLIRVDGLFKEVPADAWTHYQESDDAARAKIEKFVRDARGRRRYYLRDFIEMTDKKQAIRLELNDLIERGNNVQRVLELPLPAPPPLAGDENTIAGNFRRMQNLQQREQEVETWESAVVEWLGRRLPDRRAEFTRDVGLAPHDTPFSIHRIRVRIERLVRAKESV
jgi:hypothetical protein